MKANHSLIRGTAKGYRFISRGKIKGGAITVVTAFVVTNVNFEPAFVIWLAPVLTLTPLINSRSVHATPKSELLAVGPISYLLVLRTLLVDDHHLFREGIRLILGRIMPAAELSMAASCEEALELDPAQVDLILLDYHLPGASQFDAFSAIREHFTRAAVVIVSGDSQPATIRHLIAAGASGYIPKSSSPDTLLAALELVTGGGCYLPPAALEESDSNSGSNPGIADAISELTRRQRSVLGRAIQGKINKVIADELNIAEGTVKAHLSAAYRALGVNNRAEAVYLITRNGVTLPESFEG